MSDRRQAHVNGDVPAYLRRYVDVLGRDLAVRLFLTLGGSAVYLADRPQARSRLSGLLTADQIRALSAALHGDNFVRIPTAKPFIACHLRSQGVSVAEIARTLHVADWSVRRWTNGQADCEPATPSRQTSLFD